MVDRNRYPLPPISRIAARPGSYFRRIRAEARERFRSPETRGITLALFMLAGTLVVFLGYWLYLLSGIPTASDLRDVRRAEATIVYTADREELTRYHDKNRTWVPLDSISNHVVAALVAAEDHRFFDHWGIDVRRTLSSMVRTVRGDPQGGSTITMQLARNAFEDVGDDPTLVRKMKEWITALKIEGLYEKEEILEMYLNSVPFMFGTFGIEAAAKTYFQKRAYELDLSESSTLVGMLKGTVLYNPVRNPDASHDRRNVVLEQMHRYGLIRRATLDSLYDEPTELNFRRRSHEDNLAPHFAEHLRAWLDDWADQHGYNLYLDGLRVYTTIDSRLQVLATEAVADVGDDLQAVADVEWSAARSGYFSSQASNYRSVAAQRTAFDYFWQTNEDLQERLLKTSRPFRQLVEEGIEPDSAYFTLLADTAVVDSVRQAFQRLEVGLAAIDPDNGHVKAWVGGRDYARNRYDHVAQLRRQPGSTFKPFVYAAALDHGYSPDDLVVDESIEYVDPQTRRRWSPRNVGQVSGEPITLRHALAYSKNTVTARLGLDLGADRVAQYAANMGIRSELHRVPSISLGTSEVSLLELLSAYASIAAGGVYHQPVFVTRIENRHGRLLASFPGESRAALNPSTAYTLLDMLRSAVDYGTGQRIRGQYGIRGDLAGKTGTTQGGADGWFVLMHPNLVLGSWVGFPSPRLAFRSNYWGQGSHNALHVVGKFLRSASLPTNVSFREPPAYRAPSPDGNILFASDGYGVDSLYGYGRWADSLAWGDYASDEWREPNRDWDLEDENSDRAVRNEDVTFDVDITDEELEAVEELNRQARESSNVDRVLEEIREGRQ